MRAPLPTTALTASHPVVQLASANARLFFSDPRKAQFGHECGSQKSDGQRLSLVPVCGVQVHQHGKSIPTHRFDASSKIVGA